jgi:hypothetical protein
MNNIIKYGIFGIVLIVIIFFGLSIALTDKNTDSGAIINKIININGDKTSNISKNTNNTIYKYGNSEIIYIKSKVNIESFLSQINNDPDLREINITGTPKNSIAYETSDEKYAILAINHDYSEAIFIKSPNQKELLKAVDQIISGEEFLSQLNKKLNDFKLNTSKINANINNIPYIPINNISLNNILNNIL